LNDIQMCPASHHNIINYFSLNKTATTVLNRLIYIYITLTAACCDITLLLPPPPPGGVFMNSYEQY
jgi:hypothetical protein